jgi:hypothetical protein
MPISLAPGSPSSGRADPSVVRQMADDGVARYEEIWPLADSTIGATGTRIERSGANVEASLRAGEPESCRWRTWHSVRYVRGEWDCTLEAEAELTSDVTTFHLVEKLTAKRRGAVVFEREHRSAIPRDLM